MDPNENGFDAYLLEFAADRCWKYYSLLCRLADIILRHAYRLPFPIENSHLPLYGNQTVNDGVAHSKNPRKCAYHVTFDLDHTLDAR